MTTFVGFTGSRRVTPDQAHWLEVMIANIHIEDREYEIRTGACVGIDSIVAQAFAIHHPQVHNRIIVPADRSRVRPDFLEQMDLRGAELEFMPPGTSYRDRNLRIVEGSDWVLGFPGHSEYDPRSQRSGTWQTIRMAKAKQIPTRVMVLDYLQTLGSATTEVDMIKALVLALVPEGAE